MTSLGASSPIVSSSTLSSPSTMRAKHWLSSWRATVGAVLDFLYNGVDLFHFPPASFTRSLLSACFSSHHALYRLLVFGSHCQPCLRHSLPLPCSIVPAPSPGLTSTFSSFFVPLSGLCRLSWGLRTGDEIKS